MKTSAKVQGSRLIPRSLSSALFGTALLSTLLTTPVASQDSVTVPSSLSLTSSHANVVQDNFLGVSWELSSFDTLWGRTNSTLPNAMQNYLSNFRQRISHPLRIRVGGNSMDSSTYDPTKTDTMLTVTDDSYYNDVAVTFGPVFFEVLNAMADKVGEMQFMVGLSMQQAPEDGGDDNALLLANASEVLLGSRLDAMLLGNEPDLYANHGKRKTYTISDYMPEIDYVVDNLTSGSYGDMRNSGSIGGPTICCNWELTDVLNAGLKSLDYKYYTLQHYPDNFCDGATDTNTNISAYLTHTTIPGYTSWNSDGVLAAAEANTPVIMTEYNTCSCGGSPTISPTFTADLWAVDAALSFASSNLTAVYLHTREAGVTYNLFDPPSSGDSTETGWYTYSTYYAALMLTEVMSYNGSIVMDLNLENAKTNASSHISSYAIWDFGTATDGLARSDIDTSNARIGKFVFINYSNTTAKTFVVPNSLTNTSTIATRSLLAPHVNEELNISWAGQTVGDNGDLLGTQTTEYISCTDEEGCVITVPGPGIVLALLDPNASTTASFWEGNSTIAGLTGYYSSEAGRGMDKRAWWTTAMVVVAGLIMGW